MIKHLKQQHALVIIVIACTINMVLNTYWASIIAVAIFTFTFIAESLNIKWLRWFKTFYWLFYKQEYYVNKATSLKSNPIAYPLIIWLALSAEEYYVSNDLRTFNKIMKAQIDLICETIVNSAKPKTSNDVKSYYMPGDDLTKEEADFIDKTLNQKANLN